MLMWGGAKRNGWLERWRTGCEYCLAMYLESYRRPRVGF